MEYALPGTQFANSNNRLLDHIPTEMSQILQKIANLSFYHNDST